jgi:copper(I)-binding protein
MRGIRHIAVLISASLLAAAYVWAADVPVAVRDAWIRESPPGATMLAGYMRIENHTDAVHFLTGVHSASFGSVMVHRTVVEGGMARMVHQQRVEIPPGGHVSFEPGGYHLMLMAPERPLRAGDRVELVLELADGAELPAAFEVRRAGPGGDGQQHHHHD